MTTQLVMAFVVIPLHCRVFDGSVQPFHPAVGARVVGLFQTMLDTIGIADKIETHFAERDAIVVPWLLCELDATASVARTIGAIIGNSVRMVWILYGTASSRCSRNS